MHKMDWYTKRMEELLNADLSVPENIEELKLISNVVLNRYHELLEDETPESQLSKGPRPIGFRLSSLGYKLIKMADLLDNAGLYGYANQIDTIITKIADKSIFLYQIASTVADNKLF